MSFVAAPNRVLVLATTRAHSIAAGHLYSTTPPGPPIVRTAVQLRICALCLSLHGVVMSASFDIPRRKLIGRCLSSFPVPAVARCTDHLHRSAIATLSTRTILFANEPDGTNGTTTLPSSSARGGRRSSNAVRVQYAGTLHLPGALEVGDAIQSLTLHTYNISPALHDSAASAGCVL